MKHTLIKLANLFHYEKITRPDDKETQRIFNYYIAPKQNLETEDNLNQIDKNLILYIQAATDIDEEIIEAVLRQAKRYYKDQK